MSLLGALIVSAVMTFGLTARTAPPRLVVEEFPSFARRMAAYAVLSVTLALTSILPLSHFGQPPPQLQGAHLATSELFLGHAVLATCLVLWWALAGFRPLKQFLHLRFDHPREQIRRGVLAGLGGWAATMLAMTIVGGLLGVGRQGASGATAEIPQIVRAIVTLPVTVRIALVCSAGIVEELFFRAFLQSRSGLLLSTLLFTASHTSYGLPLMLVGVFVVSLVLGRLFRERGDVVPCMVAHAVFDGIQLFVILPAVVGAT
jgi:membrane protease YdiL (CAAX protease family)